MAREWTPAARQLLDSYLARAVDANGNEELRHDLQQHIEEELAQAGCFLVTEQDLVPVLQRLGEPVPPGNPDPKAQAVPKTQLDPKTQPDPDPPAPAPIGRLQRFWVLLLGLLLPLGTLVVELVSGTCAGFFIDPVPTFVHAALIGLVPATSLLTLIAVSRGRPFAELHDWLLGGAIAIAASYTLVFLPVLPLGLVAIAFFGLGLFLLSPPLALVSCLHQLRIRRRSAAGSTRRQRRAMAGGMVLALLLLVLVDLQGTVTEIALRRAASPDPTAAGKARSLLRRFGDHDLMLDKCYNRGARAAGLVAFLIRLEPAPSVEQLREIYYRVTGHEFSSVAPTGATPLLGRGRETWNDWDWDLGGDQVGRVLRGLELCSSRLDASVDGVAAVGYLEWTMVLANQRTWQREARATILLPPGGVASRLSLWIDGEEREAAYASRGQTREAYSRVVTARRDPALLTTCGPDRVLLQVFPVPPGGRLKVRLGITFPLAASDDTAAMVLPRLLERNFAVAEQLRHELWVEADQELSSTSPSLAAEAVAGHFALRGGLPRNTLGAATLITARRPPVTAAWCPVPDQDELVATCSLVPRPASPPPAVVVVLDGSAALAGQQETVAGLLDSLPPSISTRLLIAGDTVVETPADRSGQQQAVQRWPFAGGFDSLPALVRAWDLASELQATVLWLHGPQAITLADAEPLLQRWQRRPAGPPLVTLALVPGPNRLLESLDSQPAVTAVARWGTAADDLAETLAIHPRHLARRYSLVPADELPDGAVRTSDHLLRLVVRDQIGQLLRQHPQDREAAISLAAEHRLVTPVSGAVVLESAKQYEEAGLEPVPPGTVPAIPEPGLWLLLLTALAVGLVLAVLRGRMA